MRSGGLSVPPSLTRPLLAPLGERRFHLRDVLDAVQVDVADDHPPRTAVGAGEYELAAGRRLEAGHVDARSRLRLLRQVGLLLQHVRDLLLDAELLALQLQRPVPALDPPR